MGGRWKRLGHGALLAAAWGGVLAALAVTGEAGEGLGVLVATSGPVEVRPLGQALWRAAAHRAVLQPGDIVRTGPGGEAEVALVSGVFRMGENTVIILPPQAVPAGAGTPTGLRLLLYRGRALFKILKDRLQGTFDVITPSIVVGVKGTTFGVAQGAPTGVVVFEGSVRVVPAGRPGAPPVTVEAGQFTVLEQGQLTPPQAFQPGAPDALWGDGPTDTDGAPLAAASAGPGTASAATLEDVTPAAGASPPALAPDDGASLPGTGVLSAATLPALATVGGPPGGGGAFTTATFRTPLSRDSRRGPKGRCSSQGHGLGTAKGRGRGGAC